MRKKGLIALIVSSLLVVTFAALPLISACALSVTPGPTTPAAGEKITWRHQCAYDASDKEYIALDTFFKAIEVGTAGNFVNQPFPGETIVPTDELLSATAEGVVEVGHAAGGYWKGIVPVANIEQGLPTMYRGTLEEWHELMYEHGLLEIYRDAYAKEGVFYVGGHSYDSYPVVMSAVEIRTLSDYDGLKVRASGAPGDVFAALGSSVTWLPGAELYMALKLGTLDVITWSCEGLIGYKFYEVADYVIRPEMSNHSLSHFLVNQDAWDALPDNYKDIYIGAYHEVYIPNLYSLYMSEWEKILQLEETLPYEIVTLSDADVAEMQRIAMEVIWEDEAAKAPECKQALDIVKAYYGIS